MTVLDRFLKYITFDTTSDEDCENCPSTAKQFVLADFLADELRNIGASGVTRDEHGYVYGHIPPSEGAEDLPTIGLIAHMDTSPDVSGTNVKPEIILFDGINAPMIDEKYVGEKLVVSDRTTLLGADDKAGVAEIMTACEEIIKDPSLKHGKICIGFIPDEEIGRGADLFDVKGFGADFAYTVDGGELPEIEYENFNAAAVKLTVHGVNTHPGSAKNKMRNAVLYLNEFISMLPPAETPSHTEGREGFYHVQCVSGDETECSLRMLIRDHDRGEFERRKEFVDGIVKFLNGKYGEGTFDCSIKDSYYNMRDIIEKDMSIITRAEDAMKKAGLSPTLVPIRGGTDGSRLSYEGLPCPNLPTGGMNFHSIYEAVPVNALSKMVEVIVNLVTVR